MADSTYVYRIHPAIGMARVGNSEAYYIGPETIGGLPIVPDTESDTITSGDLRDAQGALKRQAARFRIVQYRESAEAVYPTGEGEEICIGSTVQGKTVVDILWTVHLANKKASSFVLENPNLAPQDLIIAGYEHGHLPPLRNLDEGPELTNPMRWRKLIIDPGPRAIRGTAAEPVRADKDSCASYAAGVAIVPLPDYPKSFPSDYFSPLYCPVGTIDTLGELRTDRQGRLLVVGAYGRACACYQDDGTPYPLEQPVDNDGWFDDTADGPVAAVLMFDDGTTQEVHGAWVVATDPAYAPPILNVVSLWDDIYDTWVRKLDLCPDIYRHGVFQADYCPFFDDQISLMFRSAALQRWIANLPMLAIKAHEAVGRIRAMDNPAETILGGLAFIRNPNNSGEQSVGAPLMPLSLGDQGQPFLSLTLTQYFFLTQWNASHFRAEPGLTLGLGERLDKAVLANCLGGRFSPGIDMTFIIRQPDLYIQDWRASGAGPFRIHAKPLDYRTVQAHQPLLSAGYVPLHSGAVGLEPGDASKFMSVPWHTDYNSCATHTTAPNPPTPQPSTALYWSWPAQRPVAVYPVQDVEDQQPIIQRYSVRGPGTETDNPANQGRYQSYIDMVRNWQRLGVIIPGSAIEPLGTYGPDQYLEVQSQLGEPDSSIVPPWPINEAQ